ncbi:MAG: filamentous hemagglutinin N-terminal domain-containing protein [Gammaproteobacteria bacterium]|nr:filamentous hemagglutinin N-terminal domain-containing protein [Gammaproteobacteria bacterium]
MGIRFDTFLLSPLVAAIRTATGRATGLGGALLALPGLAFAGPSGEHIVAGNVGVERPNSSHTKITQHSDQAIVNWHSFSVGTAEYVQFVQPDAQSAILNRVVGGGASEILGRIDANGRVFLVNPQGVYFGRGMQVNAAGFAASALDIDDADFLAGRYVFAQGGTGEVVNEGEINADQFVVLMGERVENEGLIQARLGTVVLASGSATTLQMDADGLVNFAVDEAAVTAAAGVTNAGQIIADGGRVVMTAKVADGLVATALNNEGLIRASSLSEAKGGIFLLGVGGDVVNSGTLDVAGVAGTAGGTVRVKSDNDIDHNGQVNADGAGGGSGGTVRFIADGRLNVREGSTVSARGGSADGRGGKLDLSARSGMTLEGEITLGAGGQLVLDPSKVRLLGNGSTPNPVSGSSVEVGEGFIQDMLDQHAHFTIVASDEIYATEKMTITSSGTGALAFSIGTLNNSEGASSNGSAFAASGGGDSFSFTPDLNGNLHLGLVNINIAGNFDATAGGNTGDVAFGNIRAGDIDITAGFNGDVTVGALTVINSSARIQVAAGETHGTLTVKGNVRAEGTTGSAGVLLFGETLRIKQGVSAIAAHTTLNGSGDAMIELGGNSDSIQVDGPVVANSGSNGRAMVYVRSNNTGGVTFRDSIKALGGRAADVRIINSNGPVSLSDVLVQASNGSLNQNIFATIQATSVVTKGTLQVINAGNTGNASLNIDAKNGANFGGPIEVKAPGSAEIFVDAEQGAIVFHKPAKAIGDPSSNIDLAFGGPGAVQTVDDGILMAPRIAIFGGKLGIDVRTHSSLVSMRFFGSNDKRLGIDNSTFHGPSVFNVVPANAAEQSFDVVALKMGGDTAINGALAANSIFIDAASGDITFNEIVSANRMFFDVANGSLAFNHDVIVGSGALAEEWGDAVALAALQNAPNYANGSPIGIPMQNGLPTLAPNAVFRAQHHLSFANSLEFNDPDTPYVIFMTDGHVDHGDVFNPNPEGTGESIAQYTSYSPDRDIHVEAFRAEEIPADQEFASFYNDANFQRVQGTSIIVGNGFLPTGPHLGERIVGSEFDLTEGGEHPFRNFVCIGAGTCTGFETIKGHFVTEIELFASGVFASGVFEVATVDEVEDSDKDLDLLDSDSEQDDEFLQSTDSSDENKGKVCSN